MAFDTTAVTTLTGTNVITEALELLGVLEEGETPSTDATTSALRTLNNLIKLWSADTAIYAQGEYTLSTVAATSEYALGISNVGYIPLQVRNATRILVADNTEVPINPLTQEEWYALADKTTSGVPVQYFFQRKVVGTSGALHLWPVPDDTKHSIKLWLQYPLRDMSVATVDVYFTQEWYAALCSGLAYMLAPKYGISPQSRSQHKDDMEEFKWTAESYDVDGSVFFQPRRNNG